MFLCVFVSVHVWLVGRGGEVGPVFVWACACGGGGVREEILRWNATSRCVCVCVGTSLYCTNTQHPFVPPTSFCCPVCCPPPTVASVVGSP